MVANHKKKWREHSRWVIPHTILIQRIRVLWYMLPGMAVVIVAVLDSNRLREYTEEAASAPSQGTVSRSGLDGIFRGVTVLYNRKHCIAQSCFTLFKDKANLFIKQAKKKASPRIIPCDT